MSTTMSASIDSTQASAPPAPKRSLRRTLLTVLKLAVSFGALAYVYSTVLGKDGMVELRHQLSTLRWEWYGVALCMQLTAIGCGLARWKALLAGQGIRASWKYLGGVWMIGRFWGLVTPGGFGLGAWRFYETVRHTKLLARAMAVAGVEKVLGQLGFGAVVVAGSVYGFQFIGTKGVILVNAFFIALVTAGLTLLAKPQAVRWLAKLLPQKIQSRVETLVEAVCAYHGKWRLLIGSALLSVGIHACSNLIYVCAARALNVELSIGTVFFGTSLQILATMFPASINGIGLREAAAVALYTSVGVPPLQAALISTVGFTCDVVISIFGMPIFLLRRTDGENPFTVDPAPHEPC
jgi:glycosyltransferase 2 family protein